MASGGIVSLPSAQHHRGGALARPAQEGTVVIERDAEHGHLRAGPLRSD